MSQPSEAELRELLAQSCRILYRLGLSDYLGHPSVRIEGTDRVLIKPKHSPRVRGMDTMTADVMIGVFVYGRRKREVGPGDPPPSEVFIHTEIYRARPDVLSVVHTHQPISTLAGIVGLPILPLLHVAAPLVEQQPVPTFACAELVVNPDLGRGLAQALGNHKVCHLQGHGIVSVADTIQAATIGAAHVARPGGACQRLRRAVCRAA